MYLGNSPLSASYLTDYFSGNNTTVAFTLSRAPVSASSVLVHISGVKQHASTYGVSGTTLTFSGAPPAGTNNIEVLHLGVQPDTVVQPSYRTITEFTATSGQTTFSPASYTAGYIDVYRNGVKLGTADYTATNGTSVVLANACSAGDYVRFEGFLITSFNNAIANTNGAVGDSLIASVSASKLTGSRTIPAASMPAGSVIQTVTGFYNSNFSTSSATYVSTGASITITPQFASSKIMIMVLGGMFNTDASGKQGFLTLYRNNTTNLGSATSGITQFYTGSGGNMQSDATFGYVDSPSTTSSTIYTVYMKTNTNSMTYNNDLNAVSLVAMEIAQ